MTVEFLFAMGQFFFSTLWLNVFTGLRQVVKGAHGNNDRLKKNKDSTAVDKALQWLCEEPEKTRVLVLLDRTHPDHPEVMRHLYDRLTVQELAMLYRIKEAELHDLHSKDVSRAKVLSEKKATSSAANERLVPEPEPEQEPEMEPTNSGGESTDKLKAAGRTVQMANRVVAVLSKPVYEDIGFKKAIEDLRIQAELEMISNSTIRE